MNRLLAAVFYSWNPQTASKRVRREIRRAGLTAPANLDRMLNRREPAQYVAAAVIAVNTRGE